MDFEFLPNLPKSNLDDRTFRDLVDECILRIPRYCPEWTNYNPSDPGITLVELFAWLTDQMLLRFNQVPRRNYVTFLELLGVKLNPPVPAVTEISYYLSAALETRYQIPAGTEVATERTETEDAIIFSTEQSLVLGVPRIRHFLTADRTDLRPEFLRDRFSNLWNQEPDGRWVGREQLVFQEQPQVGNCFYLVFEPDAPLDGNVLALTVQGEPAGSTGINPDHPARRWEVWDGFAWQSVLLRPTDDYTRGFSFEDPSQPQDISGTKEADVILHMPLNWPPVSFDGYLGRWLRCTFTQPEPGQPGYIRSPKVTAWAARTIGGTAAASQCTLIRDELLGESDGTPGQVFQLQSSSILPRRNGEHIVVIPPVGLPQVWQEVQDFSESGSNDYHYTLDPITGQIQFGPLIREPSQLRDSVQVRGQAQINGQFPTVADIASLEAQERQYGMVPPRGSMIRMAAYRTGGGRRGNVQAGALRILKTAVPYVARVVNHKPAINGADAESLEEAVIRVPKMLRTHDRAVTPEDFEVLTRQSSTAVARAYCPKHSSQQTEAGIVKVLVVPSADLSPLDRGEGLNPSQFALNQNLRQDVLTYLDDRRMLGVQVELIEPDYVGVAVQAEVGIDPLYNTPQGQQDLIETLQNKLYRFLNPLTGGAEGQGWPFGSPVYKSDLIAMFQQTPGVRYLGAVLLFELRRQGRNWVRTLAANDTVDPGATGLVCSWADRFLRSGHAISLIG